MKLFYFFFIALFASASATTTLRKLQDNDRKAVTKDLPRHLGPAFADEDVTFDREYNEDGEPPKGRQVKVDPDHPIEDLKKEDHETLVPPGEEEHVGGGGHRELYYNCYYYCWWDWWYGWITLCCPSWGCNYYYC